MFNKFLIFTFTVLVFCCFSVTAQEEPSDSATKPPQKTKYETFLAQPDKIFLTQSHLIADLPKSNFRVVVLVSWTLGEKDRVYAASVDGQVIDFEQLEPLQKRLDELLQTIKSFDQLNLSSVSYSFSEKLSTSYYSYKDFAGKEYRNLYVRAGSNSEQSAASLEPVEKLRDYIVQARAKIVLLQTK